MTEPTITAADAWQELADQLTEGQAAQLEAAAGVMSAAELVEVAADMAAGNRLQAAYAHVPAPADAVTRVWSWVEDEHGAVFRGFTGRQWRVGDITVQVCGEQRGDGTVTRFVDLFARSDDDAGISAEQARRVAVALLEAADVVDPV